MKDTENYEQLLERFYKRTTQLENRQVELEDSYQEYMKLDRDLDIGYLYPPEIDDSEPEIIEEVIKIRKMDRVLEKINE